jgi:S-DNA-T family DNA segregation ATPase FtsK/SpoIIIE
MFLTDHSANGTYVMSRRVNGEHRLDIMDDIYIAGVKLVYMGDFLAINQPGKYEAKPPKYIPRPGVAGAGRAGAALIRSPRVLEPIDTEAVEIESPPGPRQQRSAPIIFTIGPAVTMPLPILASMLSTATQGANFIMGTMMSVALSAMVAVGWAIANLSYEKRGAKKDEEYRQKTYLKYIAENEELLRQKQRENTNLMNGRHLSLSEIHSVLQHNKAVLWNRNIYQPDFLTIRLGVGTIKSQFDIVAPKRKFSLVDDNLQALPHTVRERYALIPDNAALLNLKDTKVIGVLGSRAAVREIAGAIAMQIAALHCYTDVKMAFILRPGEERYYEWARPLPHVRWQENKIRLICADDAERQNVLFYLNGALRSRMEAQSETRAEKKHPLPHIVIFCASPDLIIRENISRYLSDEGDLGLTFVLLYEYMDRLPNECGHIIQRDNDFHGYYRLDQSRDETCAVRFDEVSGRLLSQLSRQISGYTVTELSTGEIPAAISFLEMYGIASLNEWELIKRWKEHRAYESLRAMVGIGTGGKPLFLDIHEKQHGPHGLVAGTTGSGKSETIQTYILSLVMNFHPTEIALILIDYKGGGMANAFIGLPHLAGTITNLDGNQTTRALRSIKAEIKRRQTLFNQFNVNHIDNYARYFRDGAATEPMPHLIIISDEFAELKKEQPEFIKELVSTARVGRSLGVHLILATQKPSGVVDEEIWSNSRFKICLRVQDKQDSNEMLHRTDAAFLTQTGRAYMQIGNDEIFELFQSGYSGAYYELEDTNPREKAVTMIGLDGSPLVPRRKKRAGDGENRPTQLAAAVSFIRDTAERLGVAGARQLWLPELREGVTLAEIRASYPVAKEKGVTALCGLIDNPNTQTQYGALINFQALGNLLIAGVPGIGKSTMIQTILYSLVTDYRPEEVNFYIIDCSGSLTRVFADLPHCGGVVGPDDNERVLRLFGLTQSLIDERVRLFDQVRVGSYDEYRMASGQPLPTVLLVIDNLYAFNDRYPDIADNQLTSLSAGCAKYGIHLVVSVNHMSDVRFKLRQNFGAVLPLQLAERGDYHDALGVMPEFLPAALKGRGLWGKESLEYQVALAVGGENERVRAENIRAALARAGYADYDGYRAEPIRFIPKDRVYGDFIAEKGDPDSLCVGYNTRDITVHSLPLRSLYCYAVSAANRKSMENMTRNLTQAAGALGGKLYIAALRYEPDPKTGFAGVYRDAAEIFDLLVLLKDEFSRRSESRKKLAATGGDYFAAIREEYGLLFVFIDSMNDFLNLVYEPHEEEYYPLVELYFKQGKGLGVYFIAGFDQQLYNANMFKESYKLFAGHGTGIHLGGQLDKQKLYDIPFLSREHITALDMTDGLTVIDDQFASVFVPPNSI